VRPFAYETSRANLSASLGDTGLTSRSNLTGPYLDNLLHPADAFSHPQEVVADPDLSINEKGHPRFLGVGRLFG